MIKKTKQKHNSIRPISLVANAVVLLAVVFFSLLHFKQTTHCNIASITIFVTVPLSSLQ